VQRGRCSVEELIAELDRAPRNNSALLRRAVDDVRGGAQSVAEAEAIDVLQRSPLPPFEVNVPIITPSGMLIAVADCLWRRLRAVLEIDSREFHFREEDWQRTMARHSLLTRHGLSVDHYSPAQVRRNPQSWARGVEQWLRARAAELHLTYQASRNPLMIPLNLGRPEPFVVPDLAGQP
jgi:hypothetical protein